MRISSRAVIIEDGKVLTMFRRKIKEGKTKEYYVILRLPQLFGLRVVNPHLYFNYIFE